MEDYKKKQKKNLEDIGVALQQELDKAGFKLDVEEGDESDNNSFKKVKDKYPSRFKKLKDSLQK